MEILIFLRAQWRQEITGELFFWSCLGLVSWLTKDDWPPNLAAAPGQEPCTPLGSCTEAMSTVGQAPQAPLPRTGLDGRQSSSALFWQSLLKLLCSELDVINIPENSLSGLLSYLLLTYPCHSPYTFIWNHVIRIISMCANSCSEYKMMTTSNVYCSGSISLCSHSNTDKRLFASLLGKRFCSQNFGSASVHYHSANCNKGEWKKPWVSTLLFSRVGWTFLDCFDNNSQKPFFKP